MVCEEMVKEAERRLSRKLTEKEKRELMMAHGHTEEEIDEALGLVVA